MRKYICIFFYLLFFSSYFFGQNQKVDSLLNILNTAKEDTLKIDILHNLFLEYEFSDSKKAEEVLAKALVLSKKQNFKIWQGRTFIFFGYLAEDKSNYPEAIKNYLAALALFNEIGYKKGKASAYNNLGTIYQAQGNYPEAIRNQFASLKIREQIGDEMGKADSYNNIGVIYYFQGNLNEALKYYTECLKIKKRANNKKGVAVVYNNIAGVYSDQGNYSEALKNHFASLVIKKELGDQRGISASYNNIGNVYADQAEHENDPEIRASKFNDALKYYFASVDIKEVLDDKSDLATSYINVGDIYLRRKMFNEAEKYFVKAQEVAKEIGFKECLKIAFQDLSVIDSAKGNYKGAFENHKLYILYRDSLDNEETRKKTIQSQMTYDFEKKEAVAEAEHKKELENQEILAEEKSRKQKIVIASVVIGLLLVLVFVGFVFRSLRITRKQKNIIEEQKNLVEIQKLEVEQQKILVEEHQKEIIDSITYARRIQQSLLPTEIYIERNLNRLMKR